MEDSDQPPIRTRDSWPHQCDAFHFVLNHSSVMLYMGMGTGKSKVVVDVIENTNPQRTLIICPKSVLGVWRREFEKFGQKKDGLVLIAGQGSGQAKSERIKSILSLHSSIKAPIVVVIGYEAAYSKAVRPVLLSVAWDCIVLDESQKIKSPQGKTSRFVAKLGKTAKRKLCLTGTPCPNNPLDFFAQYRFLDPVIFGTSFVRFRMQYGISHHLFPSKILRWINQEELQAKLKPIMFCVASEDVLDLPEKMHLTRTVQLCPKAMKAYKDLETQLVAEIDEGIVTVDNALVKLLRLQQLTGGWLAVNDKPAVRLDFSKLDALVELLRDIGNEPVVVFCRFVNDLSAVKAATCHLGRTYGEISGATKDGLTDTAEMRPDVKVLGVQVASGSIGIDLTLARYAIIYSLGFSLGEYEQLQARLHRSGQKHVTRFYSLVAENTVDVTIYAALESKRFVIDAVLKDIQQRNG